MVVHEFEGEKELTELEICPATVWDSVKGVDRKKEAIKRGQLLEKAFRGDYMLGNYIPPEATKDKGV